jgi:predicted TPR repeat methyltransferase
MPSDTDFQAARQHFERGLALHGEGRLNEAEASYREALARLPGRPSTLTNLGALLLQQGRAAEALPLLDEALAAQPGANPEAASHRALALAELGRDAEALAAFDALAADAATASPALHHHRALCLARLGRADDALAAFDAALAQDPNFAEAWARRGGLLKDMGRPAQAIASLQRGIELGADAQTHGYLLASLGGRAAPPRAPAAYVQQLFDAYAPQFDRHLVETLEYRVPELLAQLALRHGRAIDCALDLGCGTGLAAAPLKRAAVQRLHGVDLSPRMIEHAAGCGHYERLWQADLVEHLATSHERYALVVAADVFIYLGDLDAVFAGVRRVLKPGGLFCFSVEQAADGQAFELRASSRYAHSARYVRALAARHGLAERALEAATLRLDQRQPVAGLLGCLAVARG